MALFKRYQPPQPAPTRPPGETGLLNWILREAHPFLIQTQRWLSRCVTYMGKVGVDDTDFPGVAEDKLVATTGVTITKTGAEGDRQLTFGANPNEITTIVNTTVVQQAAATGATLFPCNIPDSLLREPCTGYMEYGSGYGWGPWTAWEGVSTWRHNVAKALLRYSNTGSVPAVAGERIFVRMGTGDVPAHPELEGIYEVVDPGSASTYAVVRRATDANTPEGLCHDMAVNVLDIGDGTSRYHTLSTADPIEVDTTELAWTIATTRTSLAGSNLLTPGQAAAQADTVEYVAGVAVKSSGPNDTSFFPDGTFITQAGTPGAASIPAGPWTVSARLCIETTPVDLVTPARVDFKFHVVHEDTSVEAAFLTVSSPPITTDYSLVLTSQAILAAAGTISPTDRIEMRAYGHATGDNIQNIRLTWQNPARDTRVVTTIPMGGTIGAPPEPYYWEPGWLVDNTGDGTFVSMPESAPRDESATPYQDTVTAAEGEKELAVICTNHDVPYIWPEGRWELNFGAYVSSLASATHVKATLGTSAADGTGFTAVTGAGAFSAEYLMTETSSPGATRTVSILLPEMVYPYSFTMAMAIRFTMRTASVGAVTVTLDPGTLIKTTLDARPQITAAPTLADLGGVPTTRTIGDVDLSANRSLADLGVVMSGRLVARTIYTTGTAATHTYQAGIAAAHIFGLAGGGGGGGATSTGGSGFAGGGASGGHFFVRATAGLTTATYTVGGSGGGGSGGGGGASGTAGGDTVVVNNGTTYTAKGGSGGIVQVGGTTGAAALGGAGVAGTNGDILSPGAAGHPGIRFSTSEGCSGAGAPSALSAGGNGRKTDGAGAAGGGYGAGGAGAVAISSGGNNGGAGSAGIIIIEEWSA